MKVAITYDNESKQVFQHFGHSEYFKVYEINGDEIVSSQVIGSDGAGHEALAGLLEDKSIDVLICGGIGGGAQMALNDRGIELISGVTGDADAAIEQYLKGELVSAGVNCDHHDHAHENGGHCANHETSPCGHCGGDEESESSDCGGCGGGCGGCGPQIADIGPNAGKTVRVHYAGTLDDGRQFDSSYDRGEPLEFICGAGMMIAGFDKAVANMQPGEIVNVHLEPEEAYGMPDPNAFITVNLAQMPGSEDLIVGERVYLQNVYGQSFPVTVTAKDETTITFDANHEMAGLALNFKIELLSAE